MTAAVRFETSAGRVRVASLAELRDAAAWRAAFRHLVKDARYYDIVGSTLDFACHALLLEDGDGQLSGV